MTLKEQFDQFLAQNKVYERYYKHFNAEEYDSESWHRLNKPEDWIWCAFGFPSETFDEWALLADKWEAEVET